jgi:hypothetical protein
MFQAILCPSAGALDYMYAIAAYGVQCLAAGFRGSGAGQQGCVQEERYCMTAVVQHLSRAPDDGHRSVRNMLSVS